MAPASLMILEIGSDHVHRRRGIAEVPKKSPRRMSKQVPKKTLRGKIALVAGAIGCNEPSRERFRDLRPVQ